MQIWQRYCTIPCLGAFSFQYNLPLSKRIIHSLTWPTKCACYKGFKGVVEITCDEYWPFDRNIQSIILFLLSRLECLIAPMISLLCTKKASQACVKRCAPGKCSNFGGVPTSSLWQSHPMYECRKNVSNSRTTTLFSFLVVLALQFRLRIYNIISVYNF